MALPRVWKLIYAEGDDIPVAKRIYEAMATRFVGKPARGSPVQQWIVNDDAETFEAITNVGWNWLELEAWEQGRPGVHRYISTMDDWETRDWIISSGLARLVSEQRRQRDTIRAGL